MIYLAYYHNGFYDEFSKLLECCASKEIAEEVLRLHKLTRDKENEYEDEATWFIREREIKGAEQ